MSAGGSFAFVQLEIPGTLGITDGRYLIRGDEDGPAEGVLVVQTLGAPAPAPRRLGRTSRRRPVKPEASAPEVPLTRITAVRAEQITENPGEWLARTAADQGAVDDAVTAALGAVNRALHAHRAATADPHVSELGTRHAVALRLGYGSGDALADGRWSEAVAVSVSEPRRRRSEALRPQERLAAILGGREQVDLCETLLLRARADLDGHRPRDAALQLRAGLEALLAELPGRAGPEQEDDLAALESRLEAVRAAAADALTGDLSAARAEGLEETLAICERVLRRRRILSDPDQP